MNITPDQIAVAALIAGAVLYLARRALARKKGACGSGCGCTPAGKKGSLDRINKIDGIPGGTKISSPPNSVNSVNFV